MKHPFVKSILFLGAAFALYNCGDDAVSTIPSSTDPNAAVEVKSPVLSGTTPDNMVVSEPCWILAAEEESFIITTSLNVFNSKGVLVGTYDPTSQVISDKAGNPLVAGVDFQTLPLLQPTDGSQGGSSANIISDPNNPSVGVSSAVVQVPASSTSNNNQQQPASSTSNGNQQQPASSTSNGNQQQPASSTSNNNQQQPASSTSNNNQQGNDGTCFDKVSNTYVKPYENLHGANGESYAYKDDCSLVCYWSQDNNQCANIGTSSNNNQQQSSSSQVKSSSSSAPKSSSSSTPQSSSSQTSQNNGTTPNIQYVSGGKSGSGYATRYWDSCKPHCAWSGKAGPATTPTRTCHKDGSLAGVDEKSACDGGSAGTCLSQVPWAVNDELAYAFAATPGGEGDCGRCYELTFTGTGKYETNNRSKSLIGKRLIVMSSNIGYDVAGGQFDIMIPGGGVGAFSGCSMMGLSCAGAQYGGLLTNCEEAGGSDSKIKECLISKCNSEYTDANAKAGCLFLANWMGAAGNPNITYKEVVCPSELAAKW